MIRSTVAHVDLALPHELGRDPVRPGAVHGLAHHAHRPPLEREARRVHDRLVAEVHPAQPARLVDGQPVAGRADDRDRPAAVLRERLQVARRVGQFQNSWQQPVAKCLRCA